MPDSAVPIMNPVSTMRLSLIFVMFAWAEVQVVVPPPPLPDNSKIQKGGISFFFLEMRLQEEKLKRSAEIVKKIISVVKLTR